MIEFVLLSDIEHHKVLPDQKQSHYEIKDSHYDGSDKSRTHASVLSPISRAHWVLHGEKQNLERISNHHSRYSQHEVSIEVQKTLLKRRPLFSVITRVACWNWLESSLIIKSAPVWEDILHCQSHWKCNQKQNVNIADILRWLNLTLYESMLLLYPYARLQSEKKPTRISLA